jgi:peptide deformylase
VIFDGLADRGFSDRRLRAVAEPVSVFDVHLSRLTRDLADCVYSAPGIGIFAPHLGILKRMEVFQIRPHWARYSMPTGNAAKTPSVSIKTQRPASLLA